MTVREEAWPDGTPAWVDLMVPDRHRARDFYGPLFGWEFDEGSAETGYYTMALKNGHPVAGIGEQMEGQSGMPIVWTTYIAVDDVQASAAKAKDAGGQLFMEPMDVMGFGQMAIVADPTGAVFGMWQAGSHTGANLVNEPGGITWNELLTRDFSAAKDFYATVFGYSYGDMSGEGFTYATLDLGGNSVGGIGNLDPSLPAEVPAHWLTYFCVEDTDAAVEKLQELGGTVQSEATDTPYGRMAVVQGLNGESFALMDLSAGSGEQP